MTAHTEYALRGSCISKVLDLALTVSATKAGRAKGLIACQNSEVFDFVVACATAVGAVVANQRAIAQEKEVRIAVQESTAGVTTEAI